VHSSVAGHAASRSWFTDLSDTRRVAARTVFLSPASNRATAVQPHSLPDRSLGVGQAAALRVPHDDSSTARRAEGSAERPDITHSSSVKVGRGRGCGMSEPEIAQAGVVVGTPAQRPVRYADSARALLEQAAEQPLRSACQVHAFVEVSASGRVSSRGRSEETMSGRARRSAARTPTFAGQAPTCTQCSTRRERLSSDHRQVLRT
jgi:hypothetical protein